MTTFARIVLTPKTQSSQLLQDAQDAGFTGITSIKSSQLFFVSHPDLTESDIALLSKRVLHDEVAQDCNWNWSKDADEQSQQVEVSYLPGVTDREAFELKTAAAQLGLADIQVVTGRQYRVDGQIDNSTLNNLAKTLLCNDVVESYAIGSIEPSFITTTESDGLVEQIELASLDDDALLALSQERRLALNLSEMQVLRDHAQSQGRTLSEAELEMVAQTWSEHCFHKTFRADIDFTEKDAQGNVIAEEKIAGLLNTYIRSATEACSKDWLVSTFVDNAGIIQFDDDNVISFKVETHNHPSALEPFGGANTGVGGVIRDIMGVSARPIAVTNVLCFGPQDTDPASIPEGNLHPKQIQSGVVAGVGDYGNKMGIPTVNGSVHYHEGYTANPLVYCGCVGIAPNDSHVTSPQVGDRIVVLGGKTGRDGLKGATFSSLDLDSETAEASFASTAVQIGDPIVEKDVMEVVVKARDAKLYTAITDCGAGGLSSAIGEMAQELGAEVELTTVALKYNGLRPWEIWLSEAQERIVIAIPEGNIPALAEICKIYNVHFDNVGYMTGDAQMRVNFSGESVVNLPMELLHDGHPTLQLIAEWQPPAPSEVSNKELDLNQVLLACLADPNVASKEAIVRTYDHEVLGRTVVKPFVGVENHGPSDAAVIKPLGASNSRALAISNGINPRYGDLDPYRMALSAVDEAMRNLVAVGADPDAVSLLDNFCWGNPNLPDRLGSLVKANQGCFDAAKHFDAPYISGKDSLNNEYVGKDGVRQAIPPTLLISAISMFDHTGDTPQEGVITMDLKEAGNPIFIVGTTRNELGGSLIAEHCGVGNSIVPDLPSDALELARAMFTAKANIRSCHDLSEGGLALAAAEMSLAGHLGMELDTSKVSTSEALSETEILFSESNSRWLVEVDKDKAEDFLKCFDGLACAQIGVVTETQQLKLASIDLEVAALEHAWRGHVNSQVASGGQA